MANLRGQELHDITNMQQDPRQMNSDVPPPVTHSRRTATRSCSRRVREYWHWIVGFLGLAAVVFIIFLIVRSASHEGLGGR